MDDVWGNAWSQPEDDVVQHVPARTKVDDLPSWSLHSTANKHDEADVGTPSWSTGEVNWTEPTGQDSLWSSASVVDDVHPDAWTTPVRTNVEEHEASLFAVVDSDGVPQDFPDALKDVTRSSTPQSAETAHPEQASAEDNEIPEPISSELRPSRPTTPDGFGSFATGITPSMDVADTDAWSSPVFNDDSTNSWGSAWSATEKSPATTEHAKDEWEAAQEEKARRDRAVVSLR